MAGAGGGRWRRALDLGRLGARVAVDQGRAALAADPTAVHRTLAAQLTAELGRMRGLPTKIGQLLSMLDGVLPPEHEAVYREALAVLRSAVVPLDAATARAVLDAEPGLVERFERLDPQPVAAASIGQVHRGRLDGVEVAVKVQYPGIADAIDADLDNLSAVLGLMGVVLPGLDVRALVEGFAARAREECDYRVEASWQHRFGAMWAHDAALRVPAVHDRASGARVLTTTWIDGLELEVFLRDATAGERDAAGLALWRFAFGSLLKHGLFHADPHPGNLRFRVEGDWLGVLDFGCVQQVEEEARGAVIALVRAALEGCDLRAPSADALGLGDLDDVGREVVTGLVAHVLTPITAPQPFRFAPDFAAGAARRITEGKARLATRLLTRRSRLVARRGSMGLVLRNLLGLASTWSALGTTADLQSVTLGLLEEAGR